MPRVGDLSPRTKLGEGFPGQRMVVLPRPVVRAALARPDATDFLPTDVGYFPRASGHRVVRQSGAPQMIVILCLHGRGWARVGEFRMDIGPGQVLILPPDRYHAYGASGEMPWTIYWIHAAGRQVGRLYRLLTSGGAAHGFYAGEDPEILSLFACIIDLLSRSYGEENLLQASLATSQLLGALLRLHRSHPAAASTHERIDGTIAFVRSRLAARISVPELARLANFSRSHFAAVFRRQTGYAVLDYFTRLRMQRAAHLLDTTTLPVKQIAAAVGFDDPLYFSRKFHEIHEMSPTHYRGLKKG